MEEKVTIPLRGRYAIDETPGIAVNIIRLLSRRTRELNQKLNMQEAKLQEIRQRESR